MPDKKWYLMFTSEVGTLDNLLGPFLQGENQAQEVLSALLHADQLLADGLDWEAPTACGSPFWGEVKVIDLADSEVEALLENSSVPRYAPPKS